MRLVSHALRTYLTCQLLHSAPLKTTGCNTESFYVCTTVLKAIVVRATLSQQTICVATMSAQQLNQMMSLSLTECEKDTSKGANNTRSQFILVVLMGYIPGCPPEPPTPGCSCGPGSQSCSWQTGRGWQICGGSLQCPGRWGPGSSLHGV